MSVGELIDLVRMSNVVEDVDVDAIPRCSTHRKRLKFFCPKHEMLLCSICAVKQHRACGNVLTINEAAEDKLKQGKRILDAFAQSIALVENAAAERKAAKKALETNVQEIQNEIHEMTEKIINVVKQEERMMIEILKDKLNFEAESLDNDIDDMERTCINVKTKYDSLNQGLKSSEITVIYAVMKERVEADKRDPIENIARKQFRDVNFKFIVSPQVNSFIRHFKSLGQVLLSDDCLSSPNQATVVTNEISPQTPETNYTDFPKQNRLRDIAKWQKDSVKQLVPHSTERELGARGYTGQGEPVRGRRNLPMRALPQPDITEVHTNTRSYVRVEGRREAIARPMSTPPVASNMIQPNGNQGRNFDRNPGDYTDRDYSATVGRRGRAPSPYRMDPQQNGQNGPNSEQIYTATPVDRRRAPSPYRAQTDRPMSPWRGQPTTPTSPTGVCSVIAVKEGDSGRSFAAVQFSQPAEPVLVQAKQRPVMNTSRPMRRFSAGRYDYPERTALAESGRFTPSSSASDSDKRWIHKSSLISDPETKRLISGITMLGDRRILLVDQETYTVELYDADWRYVSEMKLQSRPFDIIPDTGNRIVLSLQSERILKFALVSDKNILSVADLGVPCDTVCYGICRGNDYYCVCCGDEVWVLSAEGGRVIRSLKTDTNGKVLFVQAEYVTIDRNNDCLFVSDAGKNTVTALIVDGHRLWEFSYEGFKPGGLKFMKQSIYICDRDQSRVIMLDSHGQVLKQSLIGRIDSPRAICFNEVGDLLLISQMRYDGYMDTERPAHMYCLDTLDTC